MSCERNNRFFYRNGVIEQVQLSFKTDALMNGIESGDRTAVLFYSNMLQRVHACVYVMMSIS